MDVSVVVTVFNEEKSIRRLLDSLLRQTKKPSEIVIVDAGSRDKTREIIREYQQNSKAIKLYVSIGSIAHGRNTAIEKAKHVVLAQIDAGCIAKNDWLEKITKPLENKDIEFVAGFYNMTADTSFQKALAPFIGIVPERFNPHTFFPSARSMAFRKEVWKRVGGYSEKLKGAGEDTLFNHQLIEHGVKITRAKDAIVYWEVPRTLKEALKKFYVYAKGDAQTAIWWDPAKRISTHNIKILSIYGRYLLGILLLLLSLRFVPALFILIACFICYICWSIWKMKDIVKETPTRLWIPVIQ